MRVSERTHSPPGMLPAHKSLIIRLVFERQVENCSLTRNYRRHAPWSIQIKLGLLDARPRPCGAVAFSSCQRDLNLSRRVLGNFTVRLGGFVYSLQHKGTTLATDGAVDFSFFARSHESIPRGSAPLPLDKSWQ